MYTGDEAKSIQYICKQGKFFFLKIQEAIQDTKFNLNT